MFENIAKLPALHGFTQEDLLQFFRIAKQQSFQAGDMVIRAGDQADCFYIVANGWLEIRSEQEMPIAQVNTGNLIGEMPLLYSQLIRQASVVALEPSLLFRFDYADYEKLAVQSKELAKKFKSNLSKIVSGRIWSTMSNDTAPLKKIQEVEVKSGPSAREVMKKASIFEGLKEEHLERLEAIATPLSAEAGEVIVHEGDPADGFFLIIEGFAEVRIKGQALARLGSSQVFGEMALVYKQAHRTADVAAVEAVRLLYFSFDDYHRLANGISEIGKRLRNTLGRVAASRSWSMPPVDERKR